MDLIDDEPGNAPEYSVSEISGAVKRTIEGGFQHVRVRGEVGRVSRPRSGHIYLDLKDDRAVLAGVMWKTAAARSPTQPEEGLEVVATGRLTTYPGQSKYQIVIESLRPAGVGALMAMLERRKAVLTAEGLFDAVRKRPLPYLPDIIGVVTSPSGAVIRDILHRLRDRFPRKVLIWPVPVQGDACAPAVARAIAGFNAFLPGGALPRPDLLIVARGGGSIEDLWGFNDEAVVRAAAASEIPLISAVGHETDTTLIDLAADYRAPTPTAAAERAVPVRADLALALRGHGLRLVQGVRGAVARRRQRLTDLSRGVPRADVLLEGPRQRLDRSGGGLAPALRAATREKRLAFERLQTRLEPALRRGLTARALRLGRSTGSLSPAGLGREVRTARGRLHGLTLRLGPALQRLLGAAMRHVRDLAGRVDGAGAGREVAAAHRRYAALARRLDPGALSRKTARGRGDLDRSLRDLHRLATGQITTLRARLDALEGRRQALGYEETLRRGYAVVRDKAGQVLTGVEATRAAARIELEFADGRIDAQTGAPRKTRSATPAKTQGQLL